MIATLLLKLAVRGHCKYGRLAQQDTYTGDAFDAHQLDRKYRGHADAGERYPATLSLLEAWAKMRASCNSLTCVLRGDAISADIVG
eukprot:1372778-Pleurochrysis_carterae.AAC.1